MTRKEVNAILDGMLEWYSLDINNIYYDTYLLEHASIGAVEWEEAKKSFTKEQSAKWSRILLYYKNRLEDLGVSKGGAANFIRDKLKQDGLWKDKIEDKVEESEMEQIIKEVADMIHTPVQKTYEYSEDEINDSMILKGDE